MIEKRFVEGAQLHIYTFELYLFLLLLLLFIPVVPQCTPHSRTDDSLHHTSHASLSDLTSPIDEEEVAKNSDSSDNFGRPRFIPKWILNVYKGDVSYFKVQSWILRLSK